jgi:hypothetical protein
MRRTAAPTAERLSFFVKNMVLLLVAVGWFTLEFEGVVRSAIAASMPGGPAP